MTLAKPDIEIWTKRFSSTFPQELRGLPGEAPTLDVVTRPIGSVVVTWTRASGVQSVRSARHVAAHDPELLVLHLVVSGTPVATTPEGTTRFRPGDLTVISSSRPYQLAGQALHEGLSFTIPRGMLTPHAERLEALALRRCTDPVVRRVVAPALARLGEAARSGDLGHADADFGELVVSLARTVAAQRHGALDDGPAPASARGAVLLSQAKAYIEGRLHDPDLRPGEVADAQFVSVRHLQKLFQAEGSTMLEWTKAARLRRARRDLGDPSQGHRTVAAIATSWGFRHPSHFRRAFQAEFGVTPTQFRRERLHAPAWYAGCGASPASAPASG